MKTQRAQRSCAVFSSTWTSGRAGKVNIHTYILGRCMLEGTGMRTYGYQQYRTKRWRNLQKLATIGEVNCCDAWMAERIHSWTERWLELFLEWLQWSPHPELLNVVWRGVVWSSCSCNWSVVVVVVVVVVVLVLIVVVVVVVVVIVTVVAIVIVVAVV